MSSSSAPKKTTMTDPQIEYVFYFKSVRIWTNLKIFWLQIECGKMNSRPADRIWPFTQVWTHWLCSRQSPPNGPFKSSMNIKILANITKSRQNSTVRPIDCSNKQFFQYQSIVLYLFLWQCFYTHSVKQYPWKWWISPAETGTIKLYSNCTIV